MLLIANLMKIHGFGFLKLDSETSDSILVELLHQLSDYDDGEEIAKGVCLVTLEGQYT